ncbi:MAG: 2-phospho-L-lactate transferase CofD family protein [bacterium]|nr:2-phospho-L-lactate transferase CofD family protein [bacterium]
MSIHPRTLESETMMNNVRAIIFDLDGTLFDLNPLVRNARQRVAYFLHQNELFASRAYALRRLNSLERRHGPYYSSSPYYFAFYDIAKALFKDKPERIRQLTRKTDPDADPIEAFVGVLEQIYNAEDVEDIAPYPDAVQTLAELREAGYLLFLVTLGRSSRQKNKINRLGIGPYFHRIINEGPPSHDYWFGEILQDQKLSPDQVVVIGDRTQDEIRAGNRLGLHTVWMHRGRFSDTEPGEGDRPDHQIQFLAQLPTLLHLAKRGKNTAQLKITVIGGGTGLPTVLRGMRTYTEAPTAIVAVTDTGASSGRIRWNLGVPPPGDIRNVLTALADPDRISPGLFRVFQHRFPNSEAESGIFKNDHIGNFLVAALTQQLGDFNKAIQTACSMLHIRGTILPASQDNVDICAELENGEHRYTEWMVRKPGKPPLKRAYLVPNEAILKELDRKGGGLKRIIDPETGQVEVQARRKKPVDLPQNQAKAPPEALQAIAEADIVVLGPGSLFTSVITDLLVPDIQKALLDRTHGLTLYVCNIVTQPGQADGFKASDHLRAIRRHFPQNKRTSVVDHMLVQDPRIFQTPKSRPWHPLLKQYEKDGKELVECDSDTLDALVPWTLADLVEEFQPDIMDRGVGDFISHDSHKVADAICRIYCGLKVPDYWGLQEDTDAR